MSKMFFVNGRKEFFELLFEKYNLCKKTMPFHVLNLSKIHFTLILQSIRNNFLKMEFFMEYCFFFKLGRVRLKTDEFNCLYFFFLQSPSQNGIQNLHVKVQVSFSDRLLSVVCLLTLHIFKFFS